MSDDAPPVSKVGGSRKKTGGRKKGTPNKTTALLKEAILYAAEAEGRDGEGTDGLAGYCRFLAKDEPRSFAVLLGKVLPMQVTNEEGGPLEIVFNTVYERGDG